MADKRWKQFERFAADLIGGKRFWANSGEAIDCESDDFVAQCKLVKTLSLAALSQLCQVAAEQAKPKNKIGMVVAKVSKRQLPAIVCMTADQFKELSHEAKHPHRTCPVCNGIDAYKCANCKGMGYVCAETGG